MPLFEQVASCGSTALHGPSRLFYIPGTGTKLSVARSLDRLLPSSCQISRSGNGAWKEANVIQVPVSFVEDDGFDLWCSHQKI